MRRSRWTGRKSERSYRPSDFDVTILGEEIRVRLRERVREIKRVGECPRSFVSARLVRFSDVAIAAIALPLRYFVPGVLAAILR